MNYDIHGLPEVLAGVIAFAIIASLFWFFAERQDISDDTRSFR